MKKGTREHEDGKRQISRRESTNNIVRGWK
jgi:hypothetical protein